MADRDIKDEVRKKYGEIAIGKGGTANCGCSPLKNCCENNSDNTALVDYKKAGEDVVEGSDLGLGCGLPTQYADIREGDVVLPFRIRQAGKTHRLHSKNKMLRAL